MLQKSACGVGGGFLSKMGGFPLNTRISAYQRVFIHITIILRLAFLIHSKYILIRADTDDLIHGIFLALWYVNDTCWCRLRYVYFVAYRDRIKYAQIRANTIPNKFEYAYFTNLFTTPMFLSLVSFLIWKLITLNIVLCPYYVHIMCVSRRIQTLLYSKRINAFLVRI